MTAADVEVARFLGALVTLGTGVVCAAAGMIAGALLTRYRIVTSASARESHPSDHDVNLEKETARHDYRERLVSPACWAANARLSEYVEVAVAVLAGDVASARDRVGVLAQGESKFRQLIPVAIADTAFKDAAVGLFTADTACLARLRQSTLRLEHALREAPTTGQTPGVTAGQTPGQRPTSARVPSRYPRGDGRVQGAAYGLGIPGDVAARNGSEFSERDLEQQQAVDGLASAASTSVAEMLRAVRRLSWSAEAFILHDVQAESTPSRYRRRRPQDWTRSRSLGN